MIVSLSWRAAARAVVGVVGARRAVGTAAAVVVAPSAVAGMRRLHGTPVWYATRHIGMLSVPARPHAATSPTAVTGVRHQSIFSTILGGSKDKGGDEKDTKQEKKHNPSQEPQSASDANKSGDDVHGAQAVDITPADEAFTSVEPLPENTVVFVAEKVNEYVLSTSSGAELIPEEAMAEADLAAYPLDKLQHKYMVIAACEEAFNARMPSHHLVAIKTAKDVADFFEDTRVAKDSAFGHSIRAMESAGHMPANLVVNDHQIL